MQNPASLAHEVFQAVAKQFGASAHDIEWMTGETSFLRARCRREVCLACEANSAWDAFPEPRYVDHGREGPRTGDCLVDDRQGNRLFIDLEFEGGTGAKERSYIGARTRLLSIAERITGLHLRLVPFPLDADIASAEQNLSQLRNSRSSNTETVWKFSCPIPQVGQLLLAGWVIDAVTARYEASAAPSIGKLYRLMDRGTVFQHEVISNCLRSIFHSEERLWADGFRAIRPSDRADFLAAISHELQPDRFHSFAHGFLAFNLSEDEITAQIAAMRPRLVRFFDAAVAAFHG